MLKYREQLIVFLILVLIGVTYRVLPHPANFAPVAAISLFSGFYFRRYFIFVPALAMLASDFFIGFYSWKLMVAVYFGIFFASFLGTLMRKNKSILTLFTYSLLGSVFFYLSTNFAVWAFGNWYPHNWQGLTECYLLAVPFFKNTIAGDLFYSSIIFGLYELAVQPKEKLRFFPKLRTSKI
jgi:hypothetical protein